jgi:metal-sulfur cluster biosynthetic enzyme
MRKSTTASAVIEALRAVADPCSIAAGVPIDLIDMGLVSEMVIDDGHVMVTLRLTSPFCMQIGLITDRICTVVGSLDGVTDVDVDIDFTSEWLPSMIATYAQEHLRQIRPFPALPLEVISR